MIARQGDKNANTKRNSLADRPDWSRMMVQEPTVRSRPNCPQREREVGTRNTNPNTQVAATCSGNHRVLYTLRRTDKKLIE